MAQVQRNGTGLSATFAEKNTNVPAVGSDIVNKTYADAIAAAAAAAEALDVRLDGSRVMTGALDMGTHAINNVVDPVSAQQAATKAYVDAVAQGLSTKASARAATTGVLPTYAYLNGVLGVGATLTKTVPFAALPAQDGVSLAVNDRVLVKDETGGNAPYNGIYIVTALGSGVAPWILTRALDCDQASDFVGAFVFVEEGTVNAGSGWVQTTPAPITVGTSNIVWTQFSGAGEITAGNGLQKSGNTLSVKLDGTTLSVSASGLKTTDGTFVKADGSVAFTADQSMGSHKLTNVTDPASAQDAATKNYVDTKSRQYVITVTDVLTTADNAKIPWVPGVGTPITSMNAVVRTASSGADIIVTFKIITLSTGATRATLGTVTITAGSLLGTAVAISDTIATTEALQMEITQIGSGTAGSTLTGFVK